MPVQRLLTMRIALLASLFAAATAVAATALAGGRATTATGPDLPQLEKVTFVSACRFSHRAPDDPIVSPGRPQRSHDHTFIGNVSTDAFSTPQSLLGAPTSCQRSEDTAAYWAPTLLSAGEPVEPEAAEVYYARRTVARVRAFPPGLMMIAGNSGATTTQSLRVTFWDCGELGRVPASSAIPTCPDSGSKGLHLHVRFPDCWDGVRLDSSDHKSHMAYSLRGTCPRTHRVAVPSITLVLEYPVAGGSGFELSSGGQLSGHADFVNAWQQGALTRLVDVCLNALRRCDRGG